MLISCRSSVSEWCVSLMEAPGFFDIEQTNPSGFLKGFPSHKEFLRISALGCKSCSAVEWLLIARCLVAPHRVRGHLSTGLRDPCTPRSPACLISHLTTEDSIQTRSKSVCATVLLVFIFVSLHDTDSCWHTEPLLAPAPQLFCQCQHLFLFICYW